MTSGGMDSTVLTFWAIANGYRVTPLFIDYGQHCATTELRTLTAVLPEDLRSKVEIIRVSDVFRSSPSRLIREVDLWQERITPAEIMLPYRNLFLLAAGAAFAASKGIQVLLTAFINSNHAHEIDATTEFLAGVCGLLEGTGSVSVEMPFRDLPKIEVARIGIGLNAPIARTFSCQVNAIEHCGSCPNCVERLAALEAIVRPAS
jgi:7-cyano-7-deazaguanine synthase